MSTLVGTFSLVRLALRLDRVRLPVWVLVTLATALSTAGAYKELYPDAASRQRVAGTIGSNPAMLAIYGPVYDSSLGAIVMWRLAVSACAMPSMQPPIMLAWKLRGLITLPASTAMIALVIRGPV